MRHRKVSEPASINLSSRAWTTAHTARQHPDGWVVSWLPDRVLVLDEAVAAMTIAETIATRDLEEDPAAVALVESLARELGLEAGVEEVHRQVTGWSIRGLAAFADRIASPYASFTGTTGGAA